MVLADQFTVSADRGLLDVEHIGHVFRLGSLLFQPNRSLFKPIVKGGTRFIDPKETDPLVDFYFSCKSVTVTIIDKTFIFILDDVVASILECVLTWGMYRISVVIIVYAHKLRHAW